MGDLAEAVDDLICTLEGVGDTTMDTLAMLVFGWILAALFILWLGKLLYARFVAASTQRNKETTPAPLAAVPVVGEPTETVVDGKSGAPIKKTSVAKSASSVGAGGGGGGGRSGYVPPTPPVRKRLTRQSPTPEVRKVKYVPAPQCTGPDNICVLWVNDVFQWLYNDFVIVNELLGVWLLSMNEFSKKAAAEQGVGVEFVRILPETNPPVLSNIFAENDSKDDVTITCDCEATPAFQLKSVRQKGEKIETSHYRVNINRFRARLNIFCVSEKLQASVKCDGWPEIKAALAPVGNIKNNLDETQLQEVINEILINALRNVEVNLNLAQYPTCPRLIRHVATPGHMLPLHYDSMNVFSSTPNHLAAGANYPIPGGKRLLVKVIRAAQLATGCVEPYCVVELDEPPQKNQTSVQKNTSSPFWDEHFLFDLSENTTEVLFEVYDHVSKPAKFLGWAIVGVDELIINPSQRQIISLQSRPMENDAVTGTITVEFLFIEGADIPHVAGGQPYKIKETIRTISPTRLDTTGTSPIRSQFYNENLTNGNHYNDNLGRQQQQQNTSLNRNTLTIHSVQRQPSQRLVKVALSDGTWKEIERVEKIKDEGEEEKTELEEKKIDESFNLDTSNGTNSEINGTKKETLHGDEASKSGDYSVSPTGTLQSQGGAELQESRGRPRKRRDFFGTIKRRLGKSRSKSVGPENDANRDDSLNRSISADRSRNDENYRLNVPGGPRSMDETSRRSSLSEASGLSSASTRTYINEASTLVLETVENGVKKHYLVPLSLAQKSKWRKKGVKLHIFNDHTFIARHLTGGTVCQVCCKSIARRIGKQGYECRDCLLKCHKHCHVKVNENCPTSTIHNIELSYITNPYTDKNIRML